MPTDSNAPEKSGANKKAAHWFGYIGTAVLAYAGSRLLGSMVWIPLIAIAVAAFVLQKMQAPKKLVPVISVTVGHTIWIASGVALLTAIEKADLAAQLTTLAEVVVVGLIVWWVLKKRSVASLCAVIAIDLLGYFVPLSTLQENTPLVAAAIIHIILRSVGIGAAIYAIVHRRNLTA